MEEKIMNKVCDFLLKEGTTGANAVPDAEACAAIALKIQ